jgi:20S proteasome subunit beta 3
VSCFFSLRNGFVLVVHFRLKRYGMCEALWRPNLEADELFEVASQALLSSLNRDALSGWGAQITIIEPGKITIKTIKARQD